MMKASLDSDKYGAEIRDRMEDDLVKYQFGRQTQFEVSRNDIYYLVCRSLSSCSGEAAM